MTEIEANKQSIRQRLRPLPRFRRRPDRRHHGRQRRVAGAAQLHRLPARCRPPLLGQPMLAFDSVKLRLEREHELSLPRIQLHDPPGLRLRRAGAALRLPPADGRLRPVGQHRQRHRSRPPHGTAPALRPHLPADHHLVRRQDGQDRARARSGSTPTSSRPTSTGSSGGTPRTATSAASSSSSPSCRSTRSPGSRRSAAARSTRPRRCSPPRRPPSSTAGAAAEEAAEAARRTFEEGAVAEALPTVEVPGRRPRRRHRRAGPLRARRPCRLQRRGPPRHRQQRHQRQRRPRHRPAAGRDPGRSRHDGAIKLSHGRKKHVLVRPA